MKRYYVKKRDHALTFKIKNGRSFCNWLKRYAMDNNAAEMFLDNLDPDSEMHARGHIENGDFDHALSCAFTWSETKEGRDFWFNMYTKMKEAKVLEDARRTGILSVILQRRRLRFLRR